MARHRLKWTLLNVLGVAILVAQVALLAAPVSVIRDFYQQQARIFTPVAPLPAATEATLRTALDLRADGSLIPLPRPAGN